jgi:hypothetical protein
MLKRTIHFKWESDYIMFLEDDISLSPLYFEYSMWCIRVFLQSPPENMAQALIGCSLYTPRLDEISATDDPQNPPRWTPNASIPPGNKIFYFQLPCSWGTVYRADVWKEFVNFTRTMNETSILVPHSRSNQWHLSWKK